MAIKTLEEAFAYIEHLGEMADICTKAQTGRICSNCKCGKKPLTLQDFVKQGDL